MAWLHRLLHEQSHAHSSQTVQTRSASSVSPTFHALTAPLVQLKPEETSLHQLSLWAHGQCCYCPWPAQRVVERGAVQARELARAMARWSSCATPPPLPGVRGDRGRSRAWAAMVGQRDGGEGDEPALDGSQRESGGRAGSGSPTTKPMPARGTGAEIWAWCWCVRTS